jgi:hypothetical protein
MSVTLYGQAPSEKRAHENEQCRMIVREIGSFGVSQRQMLMLIYLLSTELENMDHARALARHVRELGGDELFLSGPPEPDKEIVDNDDGKPTT